MRHSIASRTDYAATTLGAVRAATYLFLMLVLWIVQFSYPFISREKATLVIQIFYRTILRAMAFRVRVHGDISKIEPTLFVSNHTSYLDIPILGAIIPASFVAKADVRGWPIIGMLCERQKTVFVERRATRAASQSNLLHDHLAKGESLIIFPEGTSSEGLSVLPFKSSFFSIVENQEKPVAVQPVTIACTELDGLPITRAFRMCYAWVGDMTFASHLWQVFKRGHYTVDVIFHPAVDPKAFADRKVLAAYCQQEVARGIEQSLSGRGISTVDRPALPAPIEKTQNLIGA